MIDVSLKMAQRLNHVAKNQPKRAGKMRHTPKDLLTVVAVESLASFRPVVQDIMQNMRSINQTPSEAATKIAVVECVE
ncbi:uncharacterized protein PG998_008808 [Apiospora kogelbergensis]|uniref:uncharacterized protein n=1 Tax=Apiospora kogelbergensis TaxID=1337665 RepID=UPI003131DCC2